MELSRKQLVILSVIKRLRDLEEKGFVGGFPLELDLDTCKKYNINLDEINPTNEEIDEAIAGLFCFLNVYYLLCK